MWLIKAMWSVFYLIKSRLRDLAGDLEKKKVFSLFILGMVDESSFVIVLYLQNFFILMPRYLGIADSDYFLLQVVYGVTSMLVILPGGWLADRFSNKKLIAISLFLTTFSGLWLSLVSSPWVGVVSGKFIPLLEMGNKARWNQYIFIYILWGISTSGLLWSSLWKLVSLQGNKEQQGKVNGLQSMFNGISGALITMLAYFLYFAVAKLITHRWAFTFFIFFLSLVPSIAALLLCWRVKEKEGFVIKKSFSFEQFFFCFRDYRFWLLSVLATSIYVFKISFGFFNFYLGNGLLISALFILVLGIMRTYLFRFLTAPFVGKWSDRSKSYILFICSLLLLVIIFSLVVVFIPGFNPVVFDDLAKSKEYWRYHPTKLLFTQIFTVVIYLIIGIVTWCIVTLRWTPITELGTPDHLYGTSVGFVSVMTVSANIWLFLVAKFIQLHHQAQVVDENGVEAIVPTIFGSQLLIMVVALIGMIGFVCGLILYLKSGKHLSKEVKKVSVPLGKLTQIGEKS